LVEKDLPKRVWNEFHSEWERRAADEFAEHLLELNDSEKAEIFEWLLEERPVEMYKLVVGWIEEVCLERKGSIHPWKWEE